MGTDDGQFRVRARHLRSQVTNGKRLLAEADGNSEWARRYRDLCGLHASDLGGADYLSEAQKSLVRRVAAMEVQCELIESAMSRGEEVDWDLYNRTTGNLRRTLETLGLDRIARNADPVTIYLKKRKEKAKNEAENE